MRRFYNHLSKTLQQRVQFVLRVSSQDSHAQLRELLKRDRFKTPAGRIVSAFGAQELEALTFGHHPVSLLLTGTSFDFIALFSSSC
jgi:hypothetical protein